MPPIPAFEVVLDHRDPAHHGRMEALLVELQAWAKRHGVRHVRREEHELRPGVVRLRFTPDRAPRRPEGDSLQLSRR